MPATPKSARPPPPPAGKPPEYAFTRKKKNDQLRRPKHRTTFQEDGTSYWFINLTNLGCEGLIVLLLRNLFVSSQHRRRYGFYYLRNGTQVAKVSGMNTDDVGYSFKPRAFSWKVIIERNDRSWTVEEEQRAKFAEALNVKIDFSVWAHEVADFVSSHAGSRSNPATTWFLVPRLPGKDSNLCAIIRPTIAKAGDSTLLAFPSLLFYRLNIQPGTRRSTAYAFIEPHQNLQAILKCLANHCGLKRCLRTTLKESKVGNDLDPVMAEQALAGHLRAAQNGSARAQFNVGLCYERGHGVAACSARAFGWYKAAAEQGVAEAQFKLGVFYETGQGTERNAPRAASYYRLAACQGLAAAQLSLGVCYARGRGVWRDPCVAVRWYLQAALQNLAAAQYNLGLCYESGHGIAPDDEKALGWYRLAAQQGLPSAQYRVGLCYAKGRGVDQDLGAAVAWYRRAARGGHATARLALSWCYLEGVGVPHNSKRAAKWYRRARRWLRPAIAF